LLTHSSLFMTKLITLAFFSITLTTAYARAAVLPPPSGNDGILLVPSATNPNLSTWSGSALWDYRIGGGNSLSIPTTNGFDTLGSKWSDQAPSKDALNTNGGVLRAVFLGASSPWLDALGYTFSGSPFGDTSFALASATAPSTALSPTSLSFGDSVLFPFAAGEASAFDLWFYNSGGLHELFSPINPAETSHVSVTWRQDALLIPTLPLSEVAGSPIETPTWIVSISDGTDSFRLAVQGSNLSASDFEPVPEPATYGYCAVISLMALAACRRRRASRK
jgi:hypothetical protein